jgi:hypothetical protein
MKDGPISKIAGALSPIQIREVMARISYAASIVATRPKFFTTVKNGSLKVSAKIPKFVKTLEGDQNRFGAVMHRACGESLSKSEFENKDFILENLKLGKWTFLFDEKGRFLTDSMVAI